MALEPAEISWLTEDRQFTVAELAELSGLSETELRELVDYGAITPVDPGSSQWVFTANCLTTVQVACRLRVSFDLEPHGVALVVSLLDRIKDLESQLRELRARASRPVR